MMEPSPQSLPMVSYVIADAESAAGHQSPGEPYFELTEKMPHLKNPELIATMRGAINDVVQSRSMLERLGPRPDHESVDEAKLRLAEMKANQAGDLGRKKKDIEIYKAVIAVEEMHEAFERVLTEAERKLERIYEEAAAVAELSEEEHGKDSAAAAVEEFDEEVARVLKEAELGTAIEKMDLAGREPRIFPETIGRLKSIVVLNLSKNRLQSRLYTIGMLIFDFLSHENQAVPDSIAGLENLEELNLSENLLESLPNSISLLFNLKVLDVSRNQLITLPDSISHCRSLVELNGGFNNLTYLPTDMGFELVNLRRLDIQLNKIRFLPTSIGGLKSLRFLDVHFNALRGLPMSIGRLGNLEILNLSGNFNDLTQLPEALCDVISLKELDLSHNQIHALPNAFGELGNLTKLNLDQNPLVIPPKEVVVEGVEAVKAYMHGK